MYQLEMTTDEATPAIRRTVTNQDRDATVEREHYDTVSFTRGMGDSGQKIATVAHDCPHCDTDRMVRHWRVNPVGRDTVTYFCTNFACKYFVADRFSYVGQRRAREPMVTDADDKEVEA